MSSLLILILEFIPEFILEFIPFILLICPTEEARFRQSKGSSSKSNECAITDVGEGPLSFFSLLVVRYTRCVFGEGGGEALLTPVSRDALYRTFICRSISLFASLIEGFPSFYWLLVKKSTVAVVDIVSFVVTFRGALSVRVRQKRRGGVVRVLSEE